MEFLPEGFRSRLSRPLQRVTQGQSPPEVNAETSRQRTRRVPVEPRYEQRVARMQLSLEAGGGGEGKCANKLNATPLLLKQQGLIMPPLVFKYTGTAARAR